jgi:lauroyl/myristoyl acyltransferase
MGRVTSRAHWLNRAPLFRAAGLAALLPRRARLTLAGALGAALASACASEARVVGANLARVVPSGSAAARGRLVRELFANFAMCVADLVTTNRRSAPPGLVVPSEGDEHVDGVLAGGGLIVLTAHVGNWELAGRTLVARGGGRPLHIVMAPEADPGVERLLRREGAPVRFVTLRSPADAVPLVAALRRGEIVGMQGDRPLGHRGDVAVDFFGAPAPFPLGPFLLARAAGVPVLPAFSVLRPDRRYGVHVQAPLTVGRGEEEPALRRWVDGLASVVARHPTQWFHFADPWSAAPAH